MGCNKNAPNFSFHEHSCYICIFNIEKITRCFTYIPNLILNLETDFFSYIPFLILNFVTSTIFWNPPILSHFSYSMLKMTRNKKKFLLINIKDGKEFYCLFAKSILTLYRQYLGWKCNLPNYLFGKTNFVLLLL